MRLPIVNLLSAAALLPIFVGAVTCQIPVNPNATYPRLSIGADVVPDQATAAYSMNHFALLVNNLTASLDFYTRILGMRIVHRVEATSWFGVVYLSYSHGGRNGTGWEPSAELYRQRTNNEGLVELMYRRNRPEKLPGSGDGRGPLSHIGLVVPDVADAQKRMEENDVPILRKAGELLETLPPSLARSFGLIDLTEAENYEIVRAMPRFLMVTDPDGNVVEIQPPV
ncbi:lactoylglutathione lyase [Colletotrichum plurivorum]|uniref:Lactoylglutathione lyase n=1 Tax=Colletotrichum plurivorum TaxID=2175906 RepID=A0A8H6MZM7_9PEZI|nr:lactoylglutathione lyase [Colletotrichum plurivorum]